MITRSDCYLLLSDLQDSGIDTTKAISDLSTNKDIPISVIKFINDNRQLDLSQFYENLRKNYNNKKSQLYINIVKETQDPDKLLVTLSALLTQILLYSNKVNDKQLFLKHSRADEISKILTKYFIDYDLTTCIKLLRLIKADLKTLESIKWNKKPLISYKYI